MTFDVSTFGETMTLLMPDPPGPAASAQRFSTSIAGAESNVAVALTRLGRRVRYATRVGSDPFGDAIVRKLAEEGVDTSAVERDASAPTGLFVREATGDRVSVHYYRAGSAASRIDESIVEALDLTSTRILHITGITPALSESAARAVDAAVAEAHRLGLTVSFDPNLRLKLWSDEHAARRALLALVEQVDIVMPGSDEAQFLTGRADPSEAASALRSLGPRVVAVKLGTDGSMATWGSHSVSAPATTVRAVVDPTGAGDAWAAGLLSVLLDAESVATAEPGLLRDALVRANRLGALATSVVGDWEAMPRLADLDVR